MLSINVILVFFASINYIWCLPCALKEIPEGFVCVCNGTYCDTYEDLIYPGKGYYLIASTSEGGLRLTGQSGKLNENGTTAINVENIRNYRVPTTTEPLNVNITVDQTKLHQSIIGFGGAFTGAVSDNLLKMSKALQNQLYTSYYSEQNGIAYNMMRMTIGGCDFDLYPWTYAEYPVNDTTLSGFTHLNAEDMQKIKQIKELEQITKKYDIKKFAAAWSAPRWMKSNDAWTGKSHILKEFYQTWADYHLRWLTLMDNENMTFWGISTGNEPLDGTTLWRKLKFIDLGWTAQNQGRWVAENFGPNIRSSKFQNIKILGHDDQRTTLPFWFDQMNVGNETASSFLDGAAVHWYLDAFAPSSYNTEFHNQYPDKFLINTEGCFPAAPTANWITAILFALDYIDDFTTSVQGWVTWNLILNHECGPNYQHKVDGAPILLSPSYDEFYKYPSFYAVGQFAKFLVPGSVRIDVTTSTQQVPVVGFKRPDNSLVIILTNVENFPVNIMLNSGNTNLNISIPPFSIHTVVYQEN